MEWYFFSAVSKDELVDLCEGLDMRWYKIWGSPFEERHLDGVSRCQWMQSLVGVLVLSYLLCRYFISKEKLSLHKENVKV